MFNNLQVILTLTNKVIDLVESLERFQVISLCVFGFSLSIFAMWC